MPETYANESGEIVDAEHRALAIPDAAPAAPLGLFNTDDPSAVVTKAVAVADALMAVVKQKGWAKKIGNTGKDYLEIAAWQTIGAMLGVSAVCEWSRSVEGGWEARVNVVNARGLVIASAESQCTRDERNWKSRDDFALRSMAQTRASGKALRMALGFIASIAGFSDTPAEELPEYGAQSAPPRATASASPDGGKAQPTQAQGQEPLFQEDEPLEVRKPITPPHRAILNGLEDRILRGTGKSYEETVAIIVAQAQKHYGDPETGKTRDLFEGEQYDWVEKMLRKAADKYPTPSE
jgi:hypothetical protein